MRRHFLSKLTGILAFCALVSLPAPVNAAARDQPSFDCRKAASPSERTICANLLLSRLDSELARTWKEFLDAFLDPLQKTRMKADQKTWIAGREKCGDDGNCIGKFYQERLATRKGADPAHRFSGVYEVKDTGAFALYPIGDRYLVSIQTADPQQGNWTCQLDGEAESAGDDLKIVVGGSEFRARLKDRDTLIVPEGDSVFAAASKFCGLNGTFAFSYLRVPANP
jgi:uncharacterized protein